MHDPFASLLRAAQEGAEWAWSRLYGDLAGPVLGYLRSRGAREPEDLLGEVFLQVARGIGTFEGSEQGFRSWVFMVAHNRVIDERRRSSRRPFDPAAEVPEVGLAADAADEALDRIGTESVRHLLGQLSEGQRDVLLLRLVADLTLEQTARVLGKRVGAVKALQRRALAALARLVERQAVTL